MIDQAAPPERTAPRRHWKALIPLRLGLLVLLVTALALVALAQYNFFKEPANLGDGVLFALLAILTFVLAATQADHLTAANGVREGALWNALAAAVERAPWRLAFLISAGSLTLLALNVLRRDPPPPNYNWAVFGWLGAILLYLLAIAPPSGRPRVDWRAWWSSNGWAALIVGGLFVVAFALRVWRLETVPPVLGGDEGSFGLEAVRVIKGEIRNPFSTGWLSNPTLSMYFNAPSIRLLGNTAFALRLPWALLGAITVPVVFALATRLKGLTLGLMTAVLLATYHYHIHFSRLGINNAADPFFAALALLFLYRGYDRRSALDWALCGVVTGVAQYFYFGARSIPIILAILVASFVIREGKQFWHEQRLNVLILVGAAIISAAPMIQYALRFPADYNARLPLVGVFQSGWLEREQVIRNQGPIPILLDQVRRAALAFNAYPDTTTWYGRPQPLFDFAAGVLFLLGLGYATIRLDDRRLLPMVVWWWIPVVIGGALTTETPASQRLIAVAPPAIFFVAFALTRIGELFQQAWASRERLTLAAYLTVAVLVLSLTSVRWYFTDFTPTYRYGSFNGLVATRLAHYAKDELGPEWRIYFFGPPRMYIGYGTIPYLAPEVGGVDVPQPLTAPPDASFTPPDKNAAFVFLPERLPELEWVRQAFPGGEVEELPSPLGGDPLFIVYRVPRGQPPQ